MPADRGEMLQGVGQQPQPTWASAQARKAPWVTRSHDHGQHDDGQPGLQRTADEQALAARLQHHLTQPTRPDEGRDHDDAQRHHDGLVDAGQHARQAPAGIAPSAWSAGAWPQTSRRPPLWPTGTARMPEVSEPALPAGAQYTTVAMMAGTRATPNRSTTGIRYTKAGRVCMASSTGRSGLLDTVVAGMRRYPSARR